MPAKRQDGTKGAGQRKHPAIKDTCSPEEKKFCVMIAEGISIAKAGREVFAYTNDDASYKALNRPRVRKLLTLLQERAQEKFLEKQAERLALNLDIADTRLKELLDAPRINEEKIAVLGQLGRTKAGVDLIERSGILTSGQPVAAEGEAAETESPKPPLPIADIALLKAIDLAYKRKSGYPQSTATSAAVLQQITASRVQVYQSGWLREKTIAIEADTKQIEAAEEEANG